MGKEKQSWKAAHPEQGLSRGLPTFGRGECALTQEERVNGGLLCLLLAANATSVSIASLKVLSLIKTAIYS